MVMSWWHSRGQAWPAACAGFRLQLDAVGIVDEPVEDGVGQRRVADDVVPAIDRHLAGDDQRAGVVAVFDDLLSFVEI